MANDHGDKALSGPDACRDLCTRVAGCEVWTFSPEDSGTCRAMRRLPPSTPSPVLAVEGLAGVSYTSHTTGAASCSGGQPFLPYPEGLTLSQPSDFAEACFCQGRLYGDGAGVCQQSRLLEVRTSQQLLDLGQVHGWWGALQYPTGGAGGAGGGGGAEVELACERASMAMDFAPGEADSGVYEEDDEEEEEGAAEAAEEGGAEEAPPAAAEEEVPAEEEPPAPPAAAEEEAAAPLPPADGTPVITSIRQSVGEDDGSAEAALLNSEEMPSFAEAAGTSKPAVTPRKMKVMGAASWIKHNTF